MVLKREIIVEEYSCKAVISNLVDVLSFIEERLDRVHCPIKNKIQIAVAADEIFANISCYAYGNRTGEATVQFGLIDEPKGVKISFVDSGIPFNPLDKPDPDLKLSAEERKIGGLGIFMVKKSMDDVSYEYRDGKNYFTICKYFQEEKGKI